MSRFVMNKGPRFSKQMLTKKKWKSPLCILIYVISFVVLVSYFFWMKGVIQQYRFQNIASVASSLYSTALYPPSTLNRKTIAYVISVTADGTHSDGAAVLAHGIRKASATSKYGVDLIAIVHPNVTTSRAALRRSGWK